MIELNCSYEESKKILDLGYDFGKKFGDVYKKRDCPDKYILVECHKMKAQEFSQVSEKYFDTDVEKFTLERLSRDCDDSLYNNKHNEYFEQGEIFCNPNEEGFVPIISEAVLAKCLPDIKESGWYINASSVKLIYEGGCADNCKTGIFYLHDMVVQEFDSAHEAFTWCHEKYPEKLKAKFEEVIK